MMFNIPGWIQTVNTAKRVVDAIPKVSSDPVSTLGTSSYKSVVNPNRIAEPLIDPALSIQDNSAKYVSNDKVSKVLTSLGSAVQNSVSDGTHSAYQAFSTPAIAGVDGAPISSAVRNISDPELRANAYNEMMANTAHQREVEDLIKAGLNPVLSARYAGAGSSGYEVADYGSSGSGSGSSSGNKDSSFFGVKLKPYSNPKNGYQMAYNTFIQNSNALEGILKTVFEK